MVQNAICACRRVVCAPSSIQTALVALPQRACPASVLGPKQGGVGARCQQQGGGGPAGLTGRGGAPLLLGECASHLLHGWAVSVARPPENKRRLAPSRPSHSPMSAPLTQGAALAAALAAAARRGGGGALGGGDFAVATQPHGQEVARESEAETAAGEALRYAVGALALVTQARGSSDKAAARFVQPEMCTPDSRSLCLCCAGPRTALWLPPSS